ncbi:MAG: hypothetical protein SF097_05575 [Acidobacteriota bacterium]|nr:hypothetical protein [Acidobacteriota bacterium]
MITALGFKYQATGQVAHGSIPDTPFIESERRQVFFGAAIGIPTFYVRQDTSNQLLNAILARTKRTRRSRRYQGFLRVRNDDYCRALLQTLREDAADLIELFGIENTIRDLQARLDAPQEHSAAGKLMRGALPFRAQPKKLPTKADWKACGWFQCRPSLLSFLYSSDWQELIFFFNQISKPRCC